MTYLAGILAFAALFALFGSLRPANRKCASACGQCLLACASRDEGTRKWEEKDLWGARRSDHG